jgi:transcription initiation factor TFIIB
MDVEEKNTRVRAGSPTSLALHDQGLTTDISRTMRDSHGKGLDSAMRPTVERMRKLQTWVRTIDSKERSLSIVLSKISELCQDLRLPGVVAETAAQIYRATARTKLAKGRSILGMASATVYLACRKCGVPRTHKEVARVAGIEKERVGRYFRMVVKEVEKDKVPPTSVEKYISKLVNMAKLDPKTERLALTISRGTSDPISGGKAPAGFAAACVYISSVMNGKHLPQSEIAEFAGVSEVTIRNRYKEILGDFIISLRFEPAN